MPGGVETLQRAARWTSPIRSLEAMVKTGPLTIMEIDRGWLDDHHLRAALWSCMLEAVDLCGSVKLSNL